mgnify:CR=1 FL=1
MLNTFAYKIKVKNYVNTFFSIQEIDPFIHYTFKSLLNTSILVYRLKIQEHNDQPLNLFKILGFYDGVNLHRFMNEFQYYNYETWDQVNNFIQIRKVMWDLEFK